MCLTAKGVALKPTYSFCLDAKKYAKKVKTAPVSLEKAARERLKSSKLATPRTETIFNRLSHLFFGSSDDVPL